MPSTPFPAVRHNGAYPWQYGLLSPLLDLTTGVFPVTKVHPELDVVPKNWTPLNPKDKELMDYCRLLPSPLLFSPSSLPLLSRRRPAHTCPVPSTDGGPENHENAPVGLALIGRRLEEEKVVAMLGVIRDAVGIDYELPGSSKHTGSARVDAKLA